MWFLAGTAFAAIDGDGDGYCALGVDLDADGDCDDPYEDTTDSDCDDAQPLLSPGLVEIPGDGLDNDCRSGDDPGAYTIAGAVLEDPDGNGDLADAIGRPGVEVELWREGGDGAPDGGDDLWIRSVPTASGGAWSFGQVGEVPFFVSVRAGDLAPAAGIRPGHTVAEAWAEQTVGPAGAWCADGDGGTVVRADAGPCFGGRDAAVSDGDGGLETREHVVAVVVAGADVTGLDVALSFVALTTDRDGDDDPGARTVQGGLRQVLANADAVTGGADVRFTPAVPPAATGGGGSWWRIDAASALPAVHDLGTTLDGTAWCNGASCPLGDERAALDAIGGGQALGTGPDGRPETGDEPHVPPFVAPLLQVDGSDLDLTGASNEVSDIAWTNGGIRLDGGSVSLLESLVGVAPDGTAAASATTGLTLGPTTDRPYLQHDWILVTGDGVVREGGGDRGTVIGLAIEGAAGSVGAGIRWLPDVGTTATADKVVETWIGGHGDVGLELGVGGSTLDGFTLEDSTVTGSVSGVVVRALTASSSVSVSGSWIADNDGPGLVLEDPDSAVSVARSAFGGNAGPALDRGGEGVTGNDGAGVDAPVLTIAELTAPGVLHVTGTVGGLVDASSVVELGLVDDDGDQLGEVTAGDGLSVPHGEPAGFVGGCGVALDGTFDCALPISFAAVVPDDGVCGLVTTVGSTGEPGGNVVVVDASPDSDLDGLTDVTEVTGTGTDPTEADTDEGGVDDGAEITAGGNPLDPGDDDPDADGLSNRDEVAAGTSAGDPDSDDDGLLDGEEVDVWKTDPRRPDTDGGGVSDGDEVAAGTDPKADVDDWYPVDPDGDGLWTEDETFSDPYDPDSDDDGLGDGVEVHVFGTDPVRADTDGGGIDDATELFVDDTDPLVPGDDRVPPDLDPDRDGLTDDEELELGTDPGNPDTDADRLTDGEEVRLYATSPLKFDTDGGGVDDGTEVARGMDPRDPADDVAPEVDPGGLAGGGGVGCGCDAVQGPAGALSIAAAALVVRRRRRGCNPAARPGVPTR